MRTSKMIMAGLMATAMGGALSEARAEEAGSTELQVQITNQQIPDPSFGLVSDGHSLTSFQVKVARALRPDLNLAWFASYEYGATANQSTIYDSSGLYSDEASTRLAIHGLEAGVRLTFPVSWWLTPYAAVSGRALVGSLRLEDGLTGWREPDPTDATGKSSLYQVGAVHDVGFGGGMQAAVGVAVRITPRSNRVAVAMRMAGDEPAAVETKPSGGAGVPVSEAGPVRSPEPVSEAGPVRSPEPVSEAGPVRSPEPVTPVLPVAARPSRWGWGLNLELSYPLLSDIHFAQAGALDVQGLRVQGGILVDF